MIRVSTLIVITTQMIMRFHVQVNGILKKKQALIKIKRTSMIKMMRAVISKLRMLLKLMIMKKRFSKSDQRKKKKCANINNGWSRGQLNLKKFLKILQDMSLNMTDGEEEKKLEMIIRNLIFLKVMTFVETINVSLTLF